MSKKLTHEQFLIKAKQKNNKLDILGTYITSGTPILVKCKTCGREWNMSPDNIYSGKGCSKCYHRARVQTATKTQKQFELEMSMIDPDIRILGRYQHSHVPIQCKCLLHNYDFLMSPTHLLQGRTGCPTCFKDKIGEKNRHSHEDFVALLSKTNPEITIIGQYIHSHERIEAKCNICNQTWFPTASSLLSGVGCPHCRRSKGEQAIKIFLENNNISYIQQFKDSSLRGVGNLPLSYDFYLPDYNKLIEYQGQFHDNSTNLIVSNKQFEIQKEHDKRKKQYAIDNKIDLIEIWYYQYSSLEQILVNKLNLKNPVTTTAA